MDSKIKFPQVELLEAPDNLLKSIYVACRTCYSEHYPQTIWKETPSEEKMLSLVKKVIASGHHSTLEHTTFTFAVSGISRACSHQLVRHRHMSFSQQSQRYVTEKEQFEYITPPSIKKSALSDKYHNFMAQTQELYTEMINAGIKAEDARFILPNAATTSMVVSFNLREFIHVASIRLCTNAQLEIRMLVKKMVKLAIDKDPWLKDYLVIKCETLGYCNEFKSCGLYPTKE